MSTQRRYHVAPNGDRWTIKSEGSTRVRNRFSTQREALSEARTLNGVVVLHGRDGRFRTLRR